MRIAGDASECNSANVSGDREVPWTTVAWADSRAQAPQDERGGGAHCGENAGVADRYWENNKRAVVRRLGDQEGHIISRA